MLASKLVLDRSGREVEVIELPVVQATRRCARDHELFVRRDYVYDDRALSAGNHGRTGLVACAVEFDSKTIQAVANAFANQRSVFADAA